MNLRNLVPALGILAVSAQFANAEDKAPPAPTVTFSGWVDTIADFSTANVPADTAGNSKDEHRAVIGFQNQDSLKANIKVSDAVTGKINLFINPADGSGTSVINVREGYMSWAVNSDWTFTGGKYIDSIGWISPEPTGLYTVYNSRIGYLGIYGNDVIGVNAAFSKKDCPVSGSVHITNGYFTGADSSSVTAKDFAGGGTNKTGTRENTDLGYGLDLTYNLPKDNSFINLDVAYDPHGALFATYALSAPPAPITLDLGGSALLLGLNGQVQATKELLVAAEIMTFQVGDGELAKAKVTDSGGRRTQGMLLANYAIPKTSFPVSVSGEFQMIESKFKAGGAKTAKAMQETVAALTNPTSSTFFALNYDLTFTQFDDGTAGFKKVNTTTLSVEALLSF